MGKIAPSVARWDVYNIADELEDVIAALSLNGTADVPDELADLRGLVARMWEASRLDTVAAHKLRDQRHADWCEFCGQNCDLGCDEAQAGGFSSPPVATG